MTPCAATFREQDGAQIAELATLRTWVSVAGVADSTSDSIDGKFILFSSEIRC